MTDRDVALEERIRLSLHVVAERAAVTERPIDDGPEPTDLAIDLPARRPPRARLAIAASVVVIAIVAAVALARRSDSVDTVTTPSPMNEPALPRISFGYVPAGMTASPEVDLAALAKPPGWISTWTRPNPNGGEQGLDWLEVLVATPDQADQLPNLTSPLANGDYPLSTAVARDVYQSIAGDKGFPTQVPVQGSQATPFIGQSGRVGLAWTRADGIRLAVVETGNTSLDALTALANGLTVAFPAGPTADPSVSLESSTIPDGFTHLGDGHGDLFVQQSGTRQLVTTRDRDLAHGGAQFEVRTIARPFRSQDLGWAIGSPGATIDLLGQDGLRFVASRPPAGTASPVLGLNTVYGGRADISIRLEGIESVDELLKVAAGIRVAEPAHEADPNASTGTGERQTPDSNVTAHQDSSVLPRACVPDPSVFPIVPAGASASTADIPPDQGITQPDIEVARQYGAQHQDTYSSVVSLSRPDRIAVAFTADLDAHRAALLAIVPHPDRVLVVKGCGTEAELQTLQNSLFNDYGSVVTGAGADPVGGFVRVELRADGEATARDLTERYGERVAITVGVKPYPLGSTAPDGAIKRAQVVSCPTVSQSQPDEPIDGLEVIPQLQSTSFTAGTNPTGTVRITNAGSTNVDVEGDSSVKGYIVESGTRTVVGVYPGLLVGTGGGERLAPGQSDEHTTFTAGMADCRPGSGFLLPAGDYGLVVPLPVGQSALAGEVGHRRYQWSREVPIKVTAG